MIDLATEELLSLRQACQLLPRRRKGKRPSYACVWRWARKGCHGTRLETIKIGSMLFTSIQAVQRFCDTITAKDNGPCGDSAVLRTPSQRERQIRKADEDLRREGVLP